MPAVWDPDGLSHFQGIYAPKRNFLDSVSTTTVSFHLVTVNKGELGRRPDSIFDDKGLRRYHAIVYNRCPNQNTTALNPAEGCEIDPENVRRS
eukprot:CAMPEP_0116574728 /NCGR_PEP_ID=MMETSP0397-20121206/19559_1 /TAXON_ID=216820 /ORGANISM="Cyclophora tenuis, Strain ECT3854" /LENGTH=92 /DNA_ID=CAMNT_0004103533 /DNA_START=237 /DNA_END=511 /DNA_ORIENTATION=+